MIAVPWGKTMKTLKTIVPWINSILPPGLFSQQDHQIRRLKRGLPPTPPLKPREATLWRYTVHKIFRKAL